MPTHPPPLSFASPLLGPARWKTPLENVKASRDKRGFVGGGDAVRGWSVEDPRPGAWIFCAGGRGGGSCCGLIFVFVLGHLYFDQLFQGIVRGDVLIYCSPSHQTVGHAQPFSRRSTIIRGGGKGQGGLRSDEPTRGGCASCCLQSLCFPIIFLPFASVDMVTYKTRADTESERQQQSWHPAKASVCPSSTLLPVADCLNSSLALK